MSTIKYSQTFKSIQGEGVLTGMPSLWLRFWGCNLQCDGFGQDEPTKPETYDLPYKMIDVTDITDYTELPVFHKGCDSSYAWSARFKKFIKESTVEDMVSHLGEMLPEKNIWQNLDYEFDMVFTGGEPLLKRNQPALAAMINTWNNLPFQMQPRGITIETNGTQLITDELKTALNNFAGEVLLSFSPKLFTVSGEQNKYAIKPEVIYKNILAVKGDYALKFVLSPDPKAWEELDKVIGQIGLSKKKVWIMPVGGTIEGQEVTAGAVADMAVDRGYKVSARVHVNLYGNDPDK